MSSALIQKTINWQDVLIIPEVYQAKLVPKPFNQMVQKTYIYLDGMNFKVIGRQVLGVTL